MQQAEIKLEAPAAMAPDLLIFSDLDGSLLDDAGNLPPANRDLLIHLDQQATPVVFTSSKTREEILHLQQQLNIHQAFIPENGGGIYIPKDHALSKELVLSPWGRGYGTHFGMSYEFIRSIYNILKQDYNIRGFSDMSDSEIGSRTGLGQAAVQRAKAREFSEPFVFLDAPQPAALIEAASHHGLTITRGGSFYHLMSASQDKGKAVRKAIQLFTLAHTGKPLTIALGDAENDASMFEAVDIPILLRKSDWSYAPINAPNLRRSLQPGSGGWSEQLLLALHSIGSDAQHQNTGEWQ